MKRAAPWILCTLLALPAAAQPASTAPVFEWVEVVQPEAENPLRWPVAVAAGAADELVVADVRGSRLLVLKRGTHEWTLSREVPLDGAPEGLAHDGNRYLVSLREGHGLVAVEGERHQLRRIALPAGTEPGALAAVPGGGFVVYDRAGGEIFELDAAGAVSGRRTVDGPVTALAAAPNGSLYAAIAQRAEIVVYDADGRATQRIPLAGDPPVPAWPSAILRDTAGNLIVVDRHAGRLLRLDSSGRLEGRGARKGWDPGLLRFPAGACRLPDGLIAVADLGNGRVQLFRSLSGDDAP